jgi:hypothetical protein
MERVYGIEIQELFYKLLEDAFHPDLQAATMLVRVSMKPDSELVEFQAKKDGAYLVTIKFYV